GIRVMAILAPEHASGEEQRGTNTRPVDERAGFERMHVAERADLVREPFRFRSVRRTDGAELVAAARQIQTASIRRSVVTLHHRAPWKVRWMTSSCCPRVRRMKVTA